MIIFNGLIQFKNILSYWFERFMNTNFMKAYEEAAIRRAQFFIAQRSMNELYGLSDEQLKDIGLTRGEIYDVAMSKVKETFATRN